MLKSLQAVSQHHLAVLLVALPVLGVCAYAGIVVTAGTGSSVPTAQPLGGTEKQAAKGGNNGNGKGNGGGDGAGSENKTFTLSGVVTGLAPGVSTPLQLTVRNHAPQAMRVSTLTVTAADVKDTAGVVICSASNVLLGFDKTAGTGSIAPVDLLVAANGTSTVSFPLRLSTNAGDSCKNVTWHLTYTGTGDQA